MYIYIYVHIYIHIYIYTHQDFPEDQFPSIIILFYLLSAGLSDGNSALKGNDDDQTYEKVHQGYPRNAASRCKTKATEMLPNATATQTYKNPKPADLEATLEMFFQDALSCT